MAPAGGRARGPVPLPAPGGQPGRLPQQQHRAAADLRGALKPARWCLLCLHLPTCLPAFQAGVEPVQMVMMMMMRCWSSGSPSGDEVACYRHQLAIECVNWRLSAAVPRRASTRPQWSSWAVAQCTCRWTCTACWWRRRSLSWSSTWSAWGASPTERRKASRCPSSLVGSLARPSS